MPDEKLTIDVPGSGHVSALWTAGTGSLCFVYAPGSGASLRDPFGAYLAERLPDGCALLRFQFPYTEAGRSIPDRNPVLEGTWRAAMATVRERASGLVVGGRSMGGRIASQVVAQGAEVAGLAVFAYPLHPPGRPEQLRDAHLPAVKVPTLFCSGTRDTFGTPEELTVAAGKLANARLHLLAGADHGFNVLKASGQTREQVWAEAVQVLLTFLEGLP